MTTWDNIYTAKRQKSSTWTIPSERFFPLFKNFLAKSNFPGRHALDIGCGIGKYLKLLQENGFQTDGVDSSTVAVEMTKELLGDNSLVRTAEMFDFVIPQNKYDLIISVLTIHHGSKPQIQKLINHIHDALCQNGKIFITLPDLETNRKDGSLENNQEINTGTFIPLSEPEQGLTHSYYNQSEIITVLKSFSDVNLILDNCGDWIITAMK